MTVNVEEPDTVLIVDDEESVRQTFREWLEEGDGKCRILAAADAENALLQANKNVIDLAILDWNLGAGNDGLQLLEDLYLFNPNVVAILITGYAHQATPLDAMRMGVRDYLDKNQDLDQSTFLKAVRRQLERIRPAKRERRLHQTLLGFREAVEKILPLVQSATVINEPVPLPTAIRALLQFLIQITKSQSGVLLARSYDAHRQPAEIFRAFNSSGDPITEGLVPFASSIAGTVVSRQEACTMNLEALPASSSVELQSFERGRRSLLAVPMTVTPSVHVVWELFDKIGGSGFTKEDQHLVAAAADLGTEMLRQAMGERQMHRVLFDAIETAVGAGDFVVESLRSTVAERMEQPPPRPILDSLKESLSDSPGALVEAEETVKLAEAIRVLALRHGNQAVRHCLVLVQNLRWLLDAVSGQESASSNES
jgi:ActR/RegA family two-component response regulator